MSSKRTDEDNARRLAILDEAIAEGVKDQRTELVEDFDAAYAEIASAGPVHVFRLDGKDYPFPAAMPAQFYVYLTRHCIREMEGGVGFDINITDGNAALVLIEKAMGRAFADAVMASDKPISLIVEKLFEHISERWLGMVYKKKGEASQQTPQTPTPG